MKWTIFRLSSFLKLTCRQISFKKSILRFSFQPWQSNILETPISPYFILASYKKQAIHVSPDDKSIFPVKSLPVLVLDVIRREQMPGCVVAIVVSVCHFPAFSSVTVSSLSLFLTQFLSLFLSVKFSFFDYVTFRSKACSIHTKGREKVLPSDLDSRSTSKTTDLWRRVHSKGYFSCECKTRPTTHFKRIVKRTQALPRLVH